MTAVAAANFWNLCRQATRYYDAASEIAMPPWKAEQVKIFRPNYLFIREDGWSICCAAEGYDAVYQLFPESWKEILTKDDGSTKR